MDWFFCFTMGMLAGAIIGFIVAALLVTGGRAAYIQSFPLADGSDLIIKTNNKQVFEEIVGKVYESDIIR